MTFEYLKKGQLLVWKIGTVDSVGKVCLKKGGERYV